jgi:hypothetical protein
MPTEVSLSSSSFNSHALLIRTRKFSSTGPDENQDVGEGGSCLHAGRMTFDNQGV